MLDPAFEVRVHDDGVLLVVAPRGELDLATVPEVDVALESCTNGHQAVVIDLSGLTFLDSSGIRTLVTAMRHLGDRLALVAPPPDVARVLEISAVLPLFRWVRRPTDALAPPPTWANGQDGRRRRARP